MYVEEKKKKKRHIYKLKMTRHLARMRYTCRDIQLLSFERVSGNIFRPSHHKRRQKKKKKNNNATKYYVQGQDIVII